jgi:uncharacterized membrane protein YeaQ/YmgE (transglycosylase-associated protein family)
MKLMITIGATLGGILFGWLGAVMFDHGNQLGGWSLLIGTIGSIVGIWLGYKVAKNYL